MKTVTIRELHNKTGEILRQASKLGEIQVTDNGRVLASIVPKTSPPKTPYFARRKPSRAFNRLDASGRTGRGSDSTTAISEDREDRA